MIHIRYKLQSSDFHGIGLITDQEIKKGEVIYTASSLLDLNITIEQFDLLNDSEKKEVRYWGYFDKPTQMWHVDFDVSKFINHSDKANITQDSNHDEAYLIALRDIEKGEELTQNYLEFETVEEFLERRIPSSLV